MTRVGIIGDVHGHDRELIEMIATLEDHGVDRLVLLGDLVDRGPHSLRCLKIAREWEFTTRSDGLKHYDVIRGNHEDGYWRVRENLPKPGRLVVKGPTDRLTYEGISADEFDWIGDLPIYLEFPELDLVCLHGGVTPHYDTLEHGGEHILRVRYLDDNYYEQRGIFGETFWAEVYDGRFGTIVFGHESHSQPTHYDHAIGIDGEGYQRVHGIVVSDEDGDEVKAWTVPYQGRARKALMNFDSDKARSWDTNWSMIR